MWSLTWFLLSVGDLVEQFPVVATFWRITCSFCSRYTKPMRSSSTLLCWKRLAFQALRDDPRKFCNTWATRGENSANTLSDSEVRTGWMIVLHRRRRQSSISLSNSIGFARSFSFVHYSWHGFNLSITKSIKDCKSCLYLSYEVVVWLTL